MWDKLTKEQKKLACVPSVFSEVYLGVKPYPKQARIMDAVAEPGACVALRTCNESGKTAVVGAGLVLWHLCMFPKGQVVSTAGAWRQVTQQLIPALKRHRGRFPPEWRFLDTSIAIGGTDRYVGFSTNDPGRFEGYHGSLEDPLLIIVDEAKSVKNDIFEAVDRCRPQRLLVMSSPGAPMGEFYAAFTSKSRWYKTEHITAAECPHLLPERIQRDIEKWGENHPLVRSMVYGEFMMNAQDMVFNAEWVDRAMDNPPAWDQKNERLAACDFAAGGDENVLAWREGNRVRILDAWREEDTMSAVGRFVTLFRKHDIRPGMIVGDADGLGKPMCDALRDAGYPVHEFHGGGTPRDDAYDSKISEVWWEAARRAERGNLILPADQDLRGQLISRMKIYHQRGQVGIQSKKDMKRHGVPSPDRADAVCMACMDGVETDEISPDWKESPWRIMDGRNLGADRVTVLKGADAGW